MGMCCLTSVNILLFILPVRSEKYLPNVSKNNSSQHVHRTGRYSFVFAFIPSQAGRQPSHIYVSHPLVPDHIHSPYSTRLLVSFSVRSFNGLYAFCPISLYSCRSRAVMIGRPRPSEKYLPPPPLIYYLIVLLPLYYIDIDIFMFLL